MVIIQSLDNFMALTLGRQADKILLNFRSNFQHGVWSKFETDIDDNVEYL